MQTIIRRALMLVAIALCGSFGFEALAVTANETVPASTADIFSGTSVTHTRATVVGVEPDTNSVMLRARHGNLVRVEVNPQAGDVKKLKIGDKIHITYTRALLLHADKVDSKGIRERVDTEVTTPVSGGIATSVHRVKVVATVEKIDAANRMVTLRGPTRIVTLVASSGLPLGDLKIGDNIRADYTEATAIRVTRDGHQLQ
ncbi:hypothetical protein [Paraburkholderia phenazinium]|nr:hypothetical protein [Paraburkholderia phenazinium]